MPMYEAKCAGCGRREFYFAKIADRDTTNPRCVCESQPLMERILSAPMLAAMNCTAFVPFESPATGKPITSRTEWNEDLRRSGKIIYEKGMEKEVARNRERAKDAAFRPIEAAVDSYVTSMVAAGKLET